MLRALVALYLIVATLAGPRLCLCPGSRAAAPNALSIPLNGVPRSCDCCTTSGWATTTASQAMGPQRSGPPSAPCQCQSGKQDAAATVRAGDRAIKPSPDHDGGSRPGHTCGVPYWAPVQHAFGVGRLCNLPFYTTDDILYGFHRLRC